MPLPADFDEALWFEPLDFQRLIGAALALGCYVELFREQDGFAKPIAELLQVRPLAAAVEEICRDRAARPGPSRPRLTPPAGTPGGCPSAFRRSAGKAAGPGSPPS